MEKIKVTIWCAGTEELPRCSDLLVSCPDISILAETGGLHETGIWPALERSDILILDEATMLQHGADAIRGLHAGRPLVRSLLVIENNNENNMLSALSLGVRGVIERASLSSTLCRAIAAIHTGEVWVSRRLVEPLRNELIYLDRQAQRALDSAGHPGHDKLN